MTHKLPKLPYAYDALEPHCDAATVRLHHDKHHQTYIDNLNKLIEGRPALQPKSVEELLGEPDAIPNDIRQAVVNNAGGHFNHSLFWRLMGPNQVGNPSGPIREAIAATFGSFDEFKDKFKEAALGLFGSGWTFLVASKDGKLAIQNFANQDCPLSRGLKPLLALDVWEHAYYLKFQSRRAEWVDAWWNVVNWDEVNALWADAHEPLLAH